jgi:hypothetical protein
MVGPTPRINADRANSVAVVAACAADCFNLRARHHPLWYDLPGKSRAERTTGGKK